MVIYSSGNFDKDWNTPQNIVDSVIEMFKVIELDPCSNPHSLIPATNKIILPEDGLSIEWDYSTIFINPPYGRDAERKTSIKDWFKKAFEAHEKYNSEVLILAPVATNTTHWKDYVFNKATAICFLSASRLRFSQGGVENTKGAPMPCCIIYYGEDLEKFKKYFKSHGNIVRLDV